MYKSNLSMKNMIEYQSIYYRNIMQNIFFGVSNYSIRCQT